VTWTNVRKGLAGPISAANSLLGTAAGGGLYLFVEHDVTRDTVIVGQPSSNMVSLFRTDALFADGFE
jgi:Repeat of unknown function (DUF5650)